MRILHVIQEMAMGGAEQVVLSLSRRAIEAGHDVAVASAPGPLVDELAGRWFPVPIVGRDPLRLVKAALALRRAVRAWGPEVVHSHNPTMAVVSALATRRGRRPRALVSVHGVPEADWRRAARALRLAGLETVACGPGVASALASESCPLRAMIPNAVSPAPAPADRRALEREWGLPHTQRLAVAVGRLVPQKNHALAIRALALVPETTLVLLGEGSLRPHLEREARDRGVADRVVFAGVRPDARAIVGAADVAVFSSDWEGLPLAALEALAAGTPVVATAVRGLRELLTDGRDALLVPPDDVTALADAWRRVLADRELAAQLAVGAVALAARHSHEEMVTRYLELYESLTAA